MRKKVFGVFRLLEKKLNLRNIKELEKKRMYTNKIDDFSAESLKFILVIKQILE